MVALAFASACAPSVFVPSPAEPGSLVIAATSTPDGNRSVGILGPNASRFDLEGESQIAVFAIPPRTYFAPSGGAMDPAAARVSFSEDPAPAGSCRECQFPLEDGPQLVFPGDRCAPPSATLSTFGTVSGSELVPDEAAHELARHVRIDWPGSCGCKELPTTKSVTVESLLPAVDAATIRTFTLAPDGTVAIRRAEDILIVDPDQRRWTFPVASSSRGQIAHIPGTTPPAFAFVDSGSAWRIDAGVSSASSLGVADALVAAADESLLVFADYKGGPTLPEARLYECATSGAGCKLVRPPGECRVGTPNMIRRKDNGFVLNLDSGLSAIRDSSGNWACSHTYLRPDGSEFLARSVVRSIVTDDRIAALCEYLDVGRAEVIVYDVGPTVPAILAHLEAEGTCGDALYSDGESVIVPLGAGSGAVFSLSTRELRYESNLRRGSRIVLTAQYIGSTAAIQSPDSSLEVSAGGNRWLAYGNDLPTEASAPIVLALNDGFVSVTSTGTGLLTHAGVRISGIEPDERIERLARWDSEAFALTRRSNASYIRRLDSQAWALGEPHLISLPSIDGMTAAGGGWLFLLSMGRLHSFQEARGLSADALAGPNLEALSAAEGVVWAGGSGVLLRAAILNGNPFLQSVTLGPDELDASLQATGPAVVFAVSAQCASRARLAVAQRGIRLSLPSAHWTVAWARTGSEISCSQEGPIQVCPERGALRGGGPTPLVLGPRFLIRTEGDIELPTDAEGFAHPMAPVTGGVVSEDHEEMMTVGPYGRLAFVRAQ